MKALILAAGYGTRLYPIVRDTPKALLDVNNKPLINYILDKIENLNGLDEVIVVTNNKFYQHFKQWAQAQTSFKHKIIVVNDGTQTPDDRLGSIGDIHYVLRQDLIADDLLVIGGDNLFDYSLEEYVSFAQKIGEAVTIGLYDVNSLQEATKFGVVALDENNKISSFEEKPKEPKSTLIAMCCYYLPKKSLGLVRDYLVESKKSDTAGDYIRWLHEKRDVYGFKFNGRWYDIGSLESYEEAQKAFLS